MTAVVLLGKKLVNEYERTFVAIFVGMVERFDMVIVMDPRKGARKVSTVKRLSEAQRKDCDMVMALCGLRWRPKPEEPALDEVPVRVSAESEVPQSNLPDVPRRRVPEGREPTCVHSSGKGVEKNLWVFSWLHSSCDRIEGQRPRRRVSTAS